MGEVVATGEREQPSSWDRQDQTDFDNQIEPRAETEQNESTPFSSLLSSPK